MPFTHRNLKEDLEDVGALLQRGAGSGVPRGDQGARARAIRHELPARPARISLSYGHPNETQEEVYVVYAGAGG